MNDTSRRSVARLGVVSRLTVILLQIYC